MAAARAGTGGLGSGPQDGPAGPVRKSGQDTGPAVAALVNLTVTLATVLGLSATPGAPRRGAGGPPPGAPAPYAALNVRVTTALYANDNDTLGRADHTSLLWPSGRKGRHVVASTRVPDEAPRRHGSVGTMTCLLWAASHRRG